MISLQSLQERNNEEKPQLEIGRNWEVQESVGREDISSNNTQKSENRAKLGGKRKVDYLEGEFKKIKPTSFDGESKTGEEAKAWILGIKNYFQIYNYSNNKKVMMKIYNLRGKACIWW